MVKDYEAKMIKLQHIKQAISAARDACDYLRGIPNSESVMAAFRAAENAAMKFSVEVLNG
jgi:hypothetical protein